MTKKMKSPEGTAEPVSSQIPKKKQIQDVLIEKQKLESEEPE